MIVWALRLRRRSRGFVGDGGDLFKAREHSSEYSARSECRYDVLRQVTLAALTNADVNDFRKEVARRMLLPPWDQYIKNNINVRATHTPSVLFINDISVVIYSCFYE